MDSTTGKDNSPDAIRARVEEKRDEFAGGPEPGWQTMEAAVDDSRHQAAQQWTSGEGEPGAGASGSTSSVIGSDTGSFGGTSGNYVVESVDQDSEGMTSSGTSTGMAGARSISPGSSSNAATESAHAGVPTGGAEAPPEAPPPPSSPEHPLGIGQQCFKCGAYNDIDAENCWNCGEALTHSQLETPGLAESAQEVMQTGTIPASGSEFESDAATGSSGGDTTGGATASVDRARTGDLAADTMGSDPNVEASEGTATGERARFLSSQE